jgi:hypothetical protein
MMTIEQTVEIPANRRLTLDLDVPEDLPLGLAKVEVTFTPAVPRPKKPTVTADDLCGIAMDSSLTVERFLSMKREELLLENEKEARIWGNRK